jgi:hypothetical protein
MLHTVSSSIVCAVILQSPSIPPVFVTEVSRTASRADPPSRLTAQREVPVKRCVSDGNAAEPRRVPSGANSTPLRCEPASNRHHERFGNDPRGSDSDAQSMAARRLNQTWLSPTVSLAIRESPPTAAEVRTQQPPTGAVPSASWLRPGKADFLTRRTNAQDDLNFIWWTPSAKAGGGQLHNSAGDTRYLGGFVRPLAGTPAAGDLLVGSQYVWTPTTFLWELQGEYRLVVGLGFGAGTAKADDGTVDVDFAKVTWRRSVGGFRYIMEGQVQTFQGRTSFGNYAAAYSPHWMLMAGHDGEQWRTTFGYTASRSNATYDPAFELLYVDNSIGAVPGPRITFVNATLKMRGQFLSHGARLGRAMGPQGLEFGNPLGFLSPTWNRKLETWEMGSLLDFRLDQTRRPNGSTTRAIELFAFPFQFASPSGFWGRWFGGFTHASESLTNSRIISGGYYGRLGALTLSARAGWSVDQRDAILGVGLLRFF